MSQNEGTTERYVWTLDDFDRMSWHNATLHAFGIDPDRSELMIDIDYIVDWVEPDTRDHFMRFWVAPATVVFQLRDGYRIDVATESIDDLEIQEIERKDPKKEESGHLHWFWTIQCNEGEISFRASRFTQYLRRPPRLVEAPGFSLDERGGISFARGLGGR